MDLNTETNISNVYEVFLLFLVQSPWKLGTQLKVYYSRPFFSPVNLQHGPTENTSRGLCPLLCDVTAYAEV
jgi:hypothetical protein